MASKLYGKPTKFVRHMTQETVTITPQRWQIIPFWYCDNSVSAYTDGDDVTTKTCRLGSIIKNHKIDMTWTPYTIEPQNLYWGIVKLSFFDVYNPYIAGGYYTQAAYQGAHTDQVSGTTSYLKLYPSSWANKTVGNGSSTDQSTTNGMRDIWLDDYFKHFVSLRKTYIMDQRPLQSSRKMRVPAKCKRINPFTFYGMWVFNDSVRGATPADTQVDIKLNQYFEEIAI